MKRDLKEDPNLALRFSPEQRAAFERAGWACLRCGETKDEGRRKAMTFCDYEGTEEEGLLPLCSTCATTIRACLERGTSMTPIVLPPSLVLPEEELDDEPKPKPWQTW